MNFQDWSQASSPGGKTAGSGSNGTESGVTETKERTDPGRSRRGEQSQEVSESKLPHCGLHDNRRLSCMNLKKNKAIINPTFWKFKEAIFSHKNETQKYWGQIPYKGYKEGEKKSRITSL